MKTRDILIGVLIGALGAHLWSTMRRKKNNPGKVALMEDVIATESAKYPSPLLEEFNIVMPVDDVTKKAKKRADEIADSRYSIKANRLKKPVRI